MSELVTISIENHIADVRLNRPEKLNALSMDMFAAIAAMLKRLSQENEVRVVVLSGEGKGFCAGLDTENFASMGGGRDQSKDGQTLVERYDGGISNIAQHVAYGWKELPMPVVAAIHGACIGGGCQIALGADIRLATPDSKLSIREMHWGLIPDMSVSQTIRDVLPIDVAKELIYTARIISGEEAAKLNLVTRTCEKPYDEAMSLAEEIANKSPHATRAAKKLLNEAWHGDSASGLLMESALETGIIGKANNVEAIMSNFEKRKPNFNDPE
ncbi:MAG: crotonase/enoyl-CoA hydratase family protein [Proteobacteria bacterium]|nr:crotonase/enoyl-CoA hydratase family protein [Pseudomonadota bacterium]